MNKTVILGVIVVGGSRQLTVFHECVFDHSQNLVLVHSKMLHQVPIIDKVAVWQGKIESPIVWSFCTQIIVKTNHDAQKVFVLIGGKTGVKTNFISLGLILILLIDSHEVLYHLIDLSICRLGIRRIQ